MQVVASACEGHLFNEAIDHGAVSRQREKHVARVIKAPRSPFEAVDSHVEHATNSGEYFGDFEIKGGLVDQDVLLEIVLSFDRCACSQPTSDSKGWMDGWMGRLAHEIGRFTGARNPRRYVAQRAERNVAGGDEQVGVLIGDKQSACQVRKRFERVARTFDDDALSAVIGQQQLDRGLGAFGESGSLAARELADRSFMTWWAWGKHLVRWLESWGGGGKVEVEAVHGRRKVPPICVAETHVRGRRQYGFAFGCRMKPENDARASELFLSRRISLSMSGKNDNPEVEKSVNRDDKSSRLVLVANVLIYPSEIAV
ncbi:hypothetical protein IWX92DRAFT_433818 [Phyllosticta citricarpa]